jgi:hypothetical protein
MQHAMAPRQLAPHPIESQTLTVPGHPAAEAAWMKELSFLVLMLAGFAVVVGLLWMKA